ncbi:hypothetical protein [Paludifilum halophilum]|uniref:Uncharacterized protein n=1 Tax=Paludifilum halophilum TaxID=1642702 RepID=A0A235BBI6_9BACL|nr:hypothetical protein [Paludifilum halophilum]OYD09636.1 hypothetical protein CHM34_01090 [Paludifilum halophilum]
MGTEKMTMEERIQAFYRQSGGPNNSRIPQLMEKHLLYGKDHGMDGHRETFEDAVMDTVIQDPSLLLLFERFQRWRMSRKQDLKNNAELEKEIRQLQQEISDLKKRFSNESV